MKKNEISKILSASEKTFDSRSKNYSNAYNRVGSVMSALFPDGITLATEEDFSRMYAHMMVISKMNRYASSMKNGGHADSAHDAIVYAAMLESFTGESE